MPILAVLAHFLALVGSELELVLDQGIGKCVIALVLQSELVVPLPLLRIGEDLIGRGRKILVETLMQLAHSLSALFISHVIAHVLHALLVTAIGLAVTFAELIVLLVIHLELLTDILIAEPGRLTVPALVGPLLPTGAWARRPFLARLSLARLALTLLLRLCRGGNNDGENPCHDDFGKTVHDLSDGKRQSPNRTAFDIGWITKHVTYRGRRFELTKTEGPLFSKTGQRRKALMALTRVFMR